ncbi:hypothetical protein E2562_034498 [Oryza meyeriana var. granulata]|uniref:Uncharacterized protein n=1 Tax=Oryza meyeriana var. granulata TaxID=110450 RepID=A0A6G1CY20_9ORYZ|nr:hypothetical protein E2562_034498 [Oryza meyeriana var. granulata]
MAETVLSMARSLVGSAISKAASAAADETSLLLGVQKDICTSVASFATVPTTAPPCTDHRQLLHYLHRPYLYPADMLLLSAPHRSEVVRVDDRWALFEG